jgi:hypothetical protein
MDESAQDVAALETELHLLAAALAQGSAAERERVYRTLETSNAAGGEDRERARAVAIACARPLMVSVLHAPASRIGEAEWLRAAVLLSEMTKMDMVAVVAETLQKDDAGLMPFFSVWTTPGTVYAAVLAKEPSEWNRDDAILIASGFAVWVPSMLAGTTELCALAGIEGADFVGGIFSSSPWLADNPQPTDRYTPLVLLCLDLVRTSEIDEQPEAVVAGACFLILHSSIGRPACGKAVWEAGFLEVYQKTLARYNPMERVLRQNYVPSGMLCVFKDVVEGAQASGIEVIQPVLDAGAIDIAISTLTAYQMLGKPEAASVAGVQWGALYNLEILLSSPLAQPVVAKLRSAGVDSFRYILDTPLLLIPSIGWETSANATKIAAQVWGRDDDHGGLAFKQQDFEKILEAADHRGPAAAANPMTEYFGQAILSLCVSDLNKELLLGVTGFIPLLVDSLLLDPEHPRMTNAAMQGTTDWEAAKGPVQRVSDSYLSDSCMVVQLLLAFY